jgi:hypothetical protein
LTSLVQLFFPHHCKNQIGNPPKTQHQFSNVAPHIKLLAIFAMQSHGVNTRKCHCVARFFMCSCCTAKWE